SAKAGIARQLGGKRMFAQYDGVAMTPTFAVSPTNLNFGNVFVGSSKKDSVTVTNSGSAALNISSVSSTNGSFGVSPTNATVAPMGSQKFYIIFSPASEGTLSGNIVFTHNAAGSPSSVAVS